MPLTVNRKKCLKSGQCTYMHSDLFREGEGGWPVILVPDPTDERQRADAEDAIDLCPASAISWEEPKQ